MSGRRPDPPGDIARPDGAAAASSPSSSSSSSPDSSGEEHRRRQLGPLLPPASTGDSNTRMGTIGVEESPSAPPYLSSAAAAPREWQWQRLLRTQVNNTTAVDENETLDENAQRTRAVDWRNALDALLDRAINDHLTNVQVSRVLRRARDDVPGVDDDDRGDAAGTSMRLIRLLLPHSSPVLPAFEMLAQSLSPLSNRHLDDAVVLPAAMALLGVAAVSKPPPAAEEEVAAAHRREGRLQLLFYLCLEPTALSNLLQDNTGGSSNDRPRRKPATWLLQVGKRVDTAISDSLQHYHNHGTAFLPVKMDDKPSFVADENIEPVSVPACRVRSIIQWEDSEGNVFDRYDSTKVPAPDLMESDDERWTLQDFANWARAALDDRTLDAVFYRLLLHGVLPSPKEELDDVRAHWMEWQREQRRQSDDNGDDKQLFHRAVEVMSTTEPTFLCCVDKAWWNQWALYVGWAFHGDNEITKAPPTTNSMRYRPPAISNQGLADVARWQHGVQVGTQNDVEYIPARVWDCLYELYGGGPPVPCSIVPFSSDGKMASIVCRQDLPPPLATTALRQGACGLENLGKSSWMNPVLQCLNATPLLRAYLLSRLFASRQHLNRDNPLSSGGVIANSLAATLAEMRHSRNGQYRPAAFGDAVMRTNGQFDVNVPQDAQEFLNFLLDILHEDLNLVRNKPYVPALEDDWVQNHSLAEIERESWKRFQRRNRSIVVDVAMGLSLNTVLCAECGFSSRVFDSFSMLSIPIPAEQKKVSVVCTVVPRNQQHSGSVPGSLLHTTSYVVDATRLSDSREVCAKLSELCGIPTDRLRFFISKVCPVRIGRAGRIATDQLLPKHRVDLEPLARNSDPPVYFESKDRVSRQLFAFEVTLTPRNRVTLDPQCLLDVYGDERECRIVDTDPLPLAKMVSEKQFEQLHTEFAVGLRVDATDQSNKWYPGSIVDCSVDCSGPSGKFRVHFDNFLPKWDEWYDMAALGKRVRSLHVQSAPWKNTELLAHHCLPLKETGKYSCFGQPFCIQAFNEWSCARFGAHILVQALRFLEPATPTMKEEKNRCSEARHIVSDFVDLLVECDRENMRRLLATEGKGETTAAIQNRLVEKSSGLLKQLPFDILVATNVAGGVVDGPLPFPFSVTLTVGNYFSVRSAIVLQWLPRQQRESSKPAVLYREPEPLLHESYTRFVSSTKMKTSRGINVGDCMNELCQKKTISELEGWKCPRCNVVRVAGRTLELWRLPDVLILHVKRFSMSAKWQEKLSTLVDFPVTGLDMSPWCHKEAPREDNLYDLMAIIDHYQGTHGVSSGHYTTTCKVTACSPDGQEETAYNFGEVDSSPTWVEFDDELIKTISPDKVVRSTAYILIYTRRQLTASNVAKYSVLTN